MREKKSPNHPAMIRGFANYADERNCGITSPQARTVSQIPA